MSRALEGTSLLHCSGRYLTDLTPFMLLFAANSAFFFILLESSHVCHVNVREMRSLIFMLTFVALTGLTLGKSALKLFTVANLRYQLS